MDLLQAFSFGALQGIAEFIPVSSSGHLVLLKAILGLQEVPALFDVLLHVATLLATFIVFRKTIADIIVSLWKRLWGKADEADRERVKLFLVLVIATFFTAGIGYLVNKVDLEGSPKVVSGLLIATAVILCSTLFFRGRKGYAELTWLDGIITGVAQGIGVFPGISRSGITIAAASACGLQRDKAGEYSFLMSIPAITGAFILKLKDTESLSGAVSPLPLAFAFVTAFVMGLVCLKILMRIVKGGRLAWFAVYLIPAGIAGILFL